MNFLKTILDILYDSVVTAGYVCSDGRLISLSSDDRKMTDEGDRQRHHTVRKAGMLRRRIITSANQVK